MFYFLRNKTQQKLKYSIKYTDVVTVKVFDKTISKVFNCMKYSNFILQAAYWHFIATDDCNVQS